MTRRRDHGAPERLAQAGASTGLDALLRWAAQDRTHREALVRTRSRAATRAGVRLTATEAAVLDAAPEGLLHDMVAQLAVPQLPRRRFLHQAAAVSAAALSSGLAAQAALGCRRSGTVRGSYVMPEGSTAIAEDSLPPPQQKPEDHANPSVDELRGPRVMPEGGTGTRRFHIRGPRVMPDPHIGRKQLLDEPLDPDELLGEHEDAGSSGRGDE